MLKLITFLGALLLSLQAQAFDLQQLSDQLAKPSVIHGSFIQEKHLRALPKPLTSTGTFVLAKDHGLLWQLKTPLQQDYRITAQGIARRDGGGWQMLPGKSAGAEQNRLFLAVLQGDSSGLQRDFVLAVAHVIKTHSGDGVQVGLADGAAARVGKGGERRERRLRGHP